MTKEYQEALREELLRISDGLCVTDWKEEIRDYGLSVVLSVLKDDLMALVRLIDESDSV